MAFFFYVANLWRDLLLLGYKYETLPLIVHANSLSQEETGPLWHVSQIPLLSSHCGLTAFSLWFSRLSSLHFQILISKPIQSYCLPFPITDMTVGSCGEEEGEIHSSPHLSVSQHPQSSPLRPWALWSLISPTTARRRAASRKRFPPPLSYFVWLLGYDNIFPSPSLPSKVWCYSSTRC